MTTMNYRQLQASLKELRDVRGYDIGVKLNANFNELFKAWYTLTHPEVSESTDDTTEESSYNEENTNREAKMVKSKQPNGVVLYRGLSAIDKVTPIVVIATGISKSTANPKTGNMIQTWIIVENTYPTEAINNGSDSAICGNCPHRKNTETGKRTCYVNMMGVASVYRAYHKGNYPEYSPQEHAKYFEGKKIRWGAYGDPVNIPTRILHHIGNLVVGHTGYTHQWRNPRFSRYAEYFMASVDSLTDFLDADSAGWSTFRVLPVDSPSTGIACQGGVKTNCFMCSLCDGNETKQRHVSIHAHGGNANLVK